LITISWGAIIYFGFSFYIPIPAPSIYDFNNADYCCYCWDVYVAAELAEEFNITDYCCYYIGLRYSTINYYWGEEVGT
jgi:hypothetical protein